MIRTHIVSFIESIAKQENAFDILEEEVDKTSKDDLGKELLSCGIIPERYGHDSSEEKLWAKYCDILLNKTFNHLNIRSEVIRVRGDSADIRGAADDYSVVADAKAFRLSRTAKNQKDFKVTALDDWRRGDTYACLVAPLYQFPNRSSQIYLQAEEKNVTLLSYVHIKYLLDHITDESIEPVWNIAGALNPSKKARRYWEAVDDNVVAITNTSFEELHRYKQMVTQAAKVVGEEGILYWESMKREYQLLTKEEAIKKLIQSEKIDQKIEVIRKAIDKVNQSHYG
ncbi:MAG: HindIII family type II restriction endonuclease [Chloroflexota bacterium]|nr:HindIII family type II restriction endonuclease [Chloroflexota bacterium]